MINLMEIPTGGFADLCGRRGTMIFSFIAYIISFALFGSTGIVVTEFGLSRPALISLLFLAMFFFAIGDAFRTGTHKALIFTWLSNQGRTDEVTKVYGYTRSWSKIGSAVSVIVACIIVFRTSNFITVFFFAIIPYILNIINFLGYPKEIDCKIAEKTSLRDIVEHLKATLVASVKQAGLRRLILESMGFEGFFKASKDYLQPILMAAALPLTAALFSDIQLSNEQKSVTLIGPVFFMLFILSALASRNAYRLVSRAGHENQTAKWLWGVDGFVFLVLLPAMFYESHWIMITCFVLLYVIQNFWRPVLISRFYAHSDETKGATVLSIESQAKSLSTMILAPVLGLAIDLARVHGIGASAFWPVGALGLIFAFGFFVTATAEPKWLTVRN
jgi:hypothetical protein